MTHEGKKKQLQNSFFLTFRNKYGKAFVEECLPEFSEEEVTMEVPQREALAMLLHITNKNISDEDRDAVIIRMFLNTLIEEYPYDIRNAYYEKIDSWKQYVQSDEACDTVAIEDEEDSIAIDTSEHVVQEPVTQETTVIDLFTPMATQAFVKCHKEATLKYLLENTQLLTLNQVSQASARSACLFAYEKNGRLRSMILDQLWNELSSRDSIFNDAKNMGNRAYLYLLAGDYTKAEKQATTTMMKYPQSINTLCTLCIALYNQGKTTALDKELSKLKNSNPPMSDNIIEFEDRISSLSLEMADYDLIKNRSDFLKHVDDGIGYNHSRRIETETNTNTLNTLAYEYARRSQFDLAMQCIEKAISLKPNEANYYDSKGEILLMQGRRREAKEMWNRVIKLDPDFPRNNSTLYRQLMTESD